MGSLKILPLNKYQKTGAEYAKGLIEGGTPEIPVQQIADLTPMQRLVLDEAQRLIGTTRETGETARKYYSDILSRDIDATKSKEYQGALKEAERLKTEGKTGIRQSAELGGMLKSTPRLGAEANFEAITNSNLLQFLGQLEGEERERKERAATGLQQTNAQELANVAAVGGIAEKEQQTEQAKNTALYTAALQQVLMPYVEMMNIAQALYGMKNDYVIKDKKSSLGGTIAGGLAGGALALATGGAAGGAMQGAMVGSLFNQ